MCVWILRSRAIVYPSSRAQMRTLQMCTRPFHTSNAWFACPPRVYLCARMHTLMEATFCLVACIDIITTQNLHLHNLLKSRDNLNKIDLEERESNGTGERGRKKSEANLLDLICFIQSKEIETSSLWQVGWQSKFGLDLSMGRPILQPWSNLSRKARLDKCNNR